MTQRYLPYDDAVRFVRAAGVSSRSAFWRWHDSVNPAFIPRHPQSHYCEWTSWNDFLGTTNSFEKTTKRKIAEKKVYRRFWEAVRYVQKVAHEHNLTTQKQWEQWYDENDPPTDIPKRPHHVYEEFVGTGFGVWLGNSIKGKLMSQKNNVAVFALHTMRNFAKNIVKARMYPDGAAQMREAMANDSSLEEPFRVYVWEPEGAETVKLLFEQKAGDQGDNVWIVPNVNDLLFELDNILIWYKS